MERIPESSDQRLECRSCGAHAVQDGSGAASRRCTVCGSFRLGPVAKVPQLPVRLTLIRAH